MDWECRIGSNIVRVAVQNFRIRERRGRIGRSLDCLHRHLREIGNMNAKIVPIADQSKIFFAWM